MLKSPLQLKENPLLFTITSANNAEILATSLNKLSQLLMATEAEGPPCTTQFYLNNPES
jgi:hypothetical protein